MKFSSQILRQRGRTVEYKTWEAQRPGLLKPLTSVKGEPPQRNWELRRMRRYATFAVLASTAATQVAAHGGVLSYSWGADWYWGWRPYNR